MKIEYWKNKVRYDLGCENFDIIQQSPEYCAILVLGKETGKDENGQVLRKIRGCVYGVDQYMVVDE